MEPHRKSWNKGQKILRRNLTHPVDHQMTLTLFLEQHGMVHTAAVAQQGDLWSFEDEVLDGLVPAKMRLIPAGSEHSIAWLLWHMTRIEDLTMNMLVAGCPQIFLVENWQTRLKANVDHSGNAMNVAEIKELSATVDMDSLRAYRFSVGRRTREIVRALFPAQLKLKVDPVRLDQLKATGAVLAEAGEILEYWSSLTIAGLLLMPPTRHTFLHWNEALRIKNRLIKFQCITDSD